ncbi:MAG TPA: efflux RND transporter periplasmic adaptor subunit, partial [Adhaeribacter sp.]|nr:efflux RND transporter periplasmic adaptor subunit [Adhaeribacter sp.]
MTYRFLHSIPFRKAAFIAGLWLLLPGFFACTSTPENATEKDPETAAASPQNPNEVALTSEQYQNAGIELGTVEQKQLSATLRLNGILDVPPQNLISVSAPLGGFVKSTDLLEGMKLRKGQVLAVLENPEYITLQQEYLDAKSKLAYQQLE